jgi:hypothetical protein
VPKRLSEYGTPWLMRNPTGVTSEAHERWINALISSTSYLEHRVIVIALLLARQGTHDQQLDVLSAANDLQRLSLSLTMIKRAVLRMNDAFISKIERGLNDRLGDLKTVRNQVAHSIRFSVMRRKDLLVLVHPSADLQGVTLYEMAVAEAVRRRERDGADAVSEWLTTASKDARAVVAKHAVVYTEDEMKAAAGAAHQLMFVWDSLGTLLGSRAPQSMRDRTRAEIEERLDRIPRIQQPPPPP